MHSFIKGFAALSLITILALCAGAAGATASSASGGNPGDAMQYRVSQSSASGLPAFSERFPGIANVIRIDKQALFVLDDGFVWEITRLSDAGLAVRPTPKILEVVAEMRPGDYLANAYTDSRVVRKVSITKDSVFIEAQVVPKKADRDGDKDQFLGSYSWPFDIPIINVKDFTLIDAPWDGVQVQIVANDLYIEMSGDLILGYNFDLVPPDISYLLLEFDTDLKVTMDYTAMVAGKIDHTFDVINVTIPVYTVGFATVNVTVSLPTELTADGPVCLGGGVSFDYGFSAGVEVQNGSISPIWNSAPGNFNNLDPSYGDEANASLKTTINVGVSADVGIPNVVDLATLALVLGPYVDTIGNESPCSWQLNTDISASLAITGVIPNLLCPSGGCNWTLFDANVFSDTEACDGLAENCTCDSQVCPKGCCSGKECAAGTADDACGAGGGACVTCGANKHCEKGECVPACDAGLCPSGCCNGTKCEPGTTDAQCGIKGAACVACAGNQQCDGQICTTICDATLCPSGCCNGTQCEPAGDSNDYCGAAGAACKKCAADQHCANGDCVAGVDDDNDTTDDDNDTADDDDNDNDTADDDASPAHHNSSSAGNTGCGC